MNFRSMTISFAVLTLVGCKNVFEDNDVTLDGSVPASKVEFPKKNNVYKSTEAFRLGVGYSDKDKVAEIDVNIARIGGETGYSSNTISFKKYPDLQMCNLDTTFAPNTFRPGNYQIVIRSLDTRKNELKQEITFAVQ